MFVTYGPVKSDPDGPGAYHRVVDRQDEGNKRTMTTMCDEVVIDDMAAEGGNSRMVETADRPEAFCPDCSAAEPKKLSK